MVGRRRSYGDAADRQRDRANRGLTRWVFLLWNFGGYWPLASSIASRAEGYPYLMALSGCEVARSGPGGGRVGGAEAIPGRRRSYLRPLVLLLNRRLADLLESTAQQSRVPPALRVFSCAREEPSSGGGGGSWPGAGAATGTLLTDSAIARTGVLPGGCSCSGILVATGRWRARSHLALKGTLI